MVYSPGEGGRLKFCPPLPKFVFPGSVAICRRNVAYLAIARNFGRLRLRGLFVTDSKVLKYKHIVFVEER